MKCWNCGTELTWGGDHDLESSENFIIVSNFTCGKCGAYVEFYTPGEQEEDDE